MIEFPSINQFRSVIKHVKDNCAYVGKDEAGEAIFDLSKPLPTLSFKGTVKLHGTNAGIVYDVATKTISYQSRSRELYIGSDNAGFMLAMSKYEPQFFNNFNEIIENELSYGYDIAKVIVFGEWCGKGVQTGVAISEVPKMFVVFATKYIFTDGTTEWISIFEEDSDDCQHEIPNMYYIDEVGPVYTMDIDFNYPELAQNKMIDLTLAVEEECPVGKHFEVSGVGEGIVWTCVTPGWETSEMWFKVKGEKHSVSKVRTLAAVDVEAVESIRQFVDATVSEARLEWAVWNLIHEQLKSVEMSSMGDFIRTVYNDILKEEMDTIVASQLDPKKLGGPISNKARPWFINKVNSGVGL
jgi:hypothetical protein